MRGKRTHQRLRRAEELTRANQPDSPVMIRGAVLPDRDGDPETSIAWAPVERTLIAARVADETGPPDEQFPNVPQVVTFTSAGEPEENQKWYRDLCEYGRWDQAKFELERDRATAWAAEAGVDYVPDIQGEEH